MSSINAVPSDVLSTIMDFIHAVPRMRVLTLVSRLWRTIAHSPVRSWPRSFTQGIFHDINFFS